MTLAKKEVSEYVGIAIPFYEWWTHCHQFLTRGQRRGETVEEYFQAKRELLMEGDHYGDMVAAYPAYWSGLRYLELGILMDMRVLGHIWPGQIIGRDPRIEEWAAAPTWEPCRSCCRDWRTSGPYGRKYRLSGRTGAEASEEGRTPATPSHQCPR